MMPFAEAQDAVIAACPPPSSELVALHECAGRVLARDVFAGADLVPFARSAMDGYAVRCTDVQRLPVTLRIAATAYAAAGQRVHEPGCATAIATGAAIPAGADCVVPIEDVTVRDGAITIAHRIRLGACIFPPGEDARRGDVLAARGTWLRPAGIGLLAANGTAVVDVFVRPRVAVICGGDELVGIGDAPGYGQIRDSNGIMLATALTALGAVVQPPVRLPDDPHRVRAALLHAFASADLLVTTGGASVGERDFVKRACTDLGVRFVFSEVGLRPAKPTAFGRRADRVIAVLPGNPAAAFVALHEFVAPAVRALGGHAEVRLPRVEAALAGTLNAKPGRHFAVFTALTLGRTGFIARPLDNQCSSLTRTAATGAGLIIVPPGPRAYREGERVEVDIVDWALVAVPYGSAGVRPNEFAFA